MYWRKTCTGSSPPVIGRTKMKWPMRTTGHRYICDTRYAAVRLTAKVCTIRYRMRQHRKLSHRIPRPESNHSRIPALYWADFSDTEWTRENIRFFWEEVCPYRGWFSAPEIPEVSQEALCAYDPRVKSVSPSKLRETMARLQSA